MSSFESSLKSNFTSVQKLVHSGPGQHLQYATGRRNTLSLHGTLMLYPIHDLVGLITRFGKAIIEPTYDSSEGLVWGLTIGRGEAGLQGDGMGVWAVVNKGNMRQIRSERWDLVSATDSTRFARNVMVTNKCCSHSPSFTRTSQYQRHSNSLLNILRSQRFFSRHPMWESQSSWPTTLPPRSLSTSSYVSGPIERLAMLSFFLDYRSACQPTRERCPAHQIPV